METVLVLIATEQETNYDSSLGGLQPPQRQASWFFPHVLSTKHCLRRGRIGLGHVESMSKLANNSNSIHQWVKLKNHSPSAQQNTWQSMSNNYRL
jgi:hypothetical protein